MSARLTTRPSVKPSPRPARGPFVFRKLEMTFPHESHLVTIIADHSLSGSIAGTISLRMSGKYAVEFSRLFVAEHCRREGLGKKLVNMAEKIAHAAGGGALSCSVHPKNAEALAFYKKLGFAVIFQFADGDLLLSRSVVPF